MGTIPFMKSYTYLILTVHGRWESHNRSILLVYKLTKSGLALDDAERDTLLTAQRGQPHDELNRDDIMSDGHKGYLLLRDQLSDMLKAELEHVLLYHLQLLACLLGNGQLLQSLLLGSLGLWDVFAQQLEELGGLVFVDGLVELSDGRGDLQSLVQNL